MRPVWLVLLALCLLLAGRPSPARAAAPRAAVCETELERLREVPGGLDNLLDPVLETQEEFSEAFARAWEAFTCLEAQEARLSADEETLHTLLELFLTFTGGHGEPEGASTLWMINPAEWDDPALHTIRDEVGLPPPEGYFYVRLYTSRLELPPRLERAFADTDVVGVTMLTRYIAVLVVDPIGWHNRQRLDNETRGTLSHELIHAYINASQGYGVSGELPTWYREGLAIYLSGGGRSYAYTGPVMSFTRTLPDDYRRYEQVFRFLEARLGRAGLYERIRESVQAADPEALYAGLEYADEGAFLAGVTAWAEAQARRERILGGLAFLVSVGGVLLFLALREPEFVCRNCQNGGRRQAFSAGECPFCGAPVEVE